MIDKVALENSKRGNSRQSQAALNAPNSAIAQQKESSMSTKNSTLLSS
jgi:hypothetical protein